MKTGRKAEALLAATLILASCGPVARAVGKAAAGSGDEVARGAARAGEAGSAHAGESAAARAAHGEGEAGRAREVAGEVGNEALGRGVEAGFEQALAPTDPDDGDPRPKAPAAR
jgi:hypothetical protein